MRRVHVKAGGRFRLLASSLAAALLVGGSAPGVCADNGHSQILDGVDAGELVATEAAIFLSNQLAIPLRAHRCGAPTFSVGSGNYRA
jgi:hypothetical protein